jgi:hypothetical protein
MNSKIMAFFAATVSAGRVGQSSDEDIVACHELPGVHITCGSHCWPNCESHGSGHPDAQDYNHYMVIPEARSCYVDTIAYGRFDAYKS